MGFIRIYCEAIFLIYFCIGALALMNSIIAVVVECTLSAARASSDKEEDEKRQADATGTYISPCDCK